MPVTTSTLVTEGPDLVRTARTTGLLYLGMAVTGALGFLLIRNQLHVEHDAAATLANLTDQEALARAGVLLEIGTVGLQVLVALWFYRLFRTVDSFAAGAIAVFGVMNAVAVLGSAAMLGAALEMVHGDRVAGGDPASVVQLLYVAGENFWAVGNLFFGLWLIPMGWVAMRSGWFPQLLGWLLIGGGVGYVASGLLTYLIPDAGSLVEALVVPATIGELWIIGHLIVVGVRSRGSG